MSKVVILEVTKGENNYLVEIALVEQQSEGEQSQTRWLGKGIVEIPQDTKKTRIKAMIVDAANQIMKAHKDAIKKRKDIDELELPEIT